MHYNVHMKWLFVSNSNEDRGTKFLRKNSALCYILGIGRWYFRLANHFCTSAILVAFDLGAQEKSYWCKENFVSVLNTMDGEITSPSSWIFSSLKHLQTPVVVLTSFIGSAKRHQRQSFETFFRVRDLSACRHVGWLSGREILTKQNTSNMAQRQSQWRRSFENHSHPWRYSTYYLGVDLFYYFTFFFL